GAQTVQWEGQELPIVLLYPPMQDPDRAQRERAWRTFNERKIEDHEALFALWIKGLQVRQQMARNAGYDNYREYRWHQIYRFDYTPDDCKAFHEAVRQVVVPVASQLAQKRRTLLGVERLRPWDSADSPWSIAVDPRASSAPRTLEERTALLPTLANLFCQIDPALGDYFETMIKEQCFDLEARANKAPVAYNAPLEVKQLPFLFGSVITIQQVVWLLFHEAGHAFHTFEMRGLPYLHQRSLLPMEFAEVASTSMEFIASLHLSSCGLCSKEEARRLRLHQMEEALLSLPMIIRGDAFQHWVYENPEQAQDLETVGRTWAELGRRFEPDPDWSECEAANSNGWLYGNFFEAPFYYIEYAFALIGALQIWRNYLRDPQGTIQQYRQALSFGATRPLPELYRAAGAQFAFDVTILQEIVHLMTSKIKELEQEIEESQAGPD
ncbi:MAG TPA: M3 family metallopeptidase, partial [Ktedonobacteraceae bacterium]|nr:M3 family metallopeptidase [Ktedonobacteraceae bacterium]